MRVYRPTPVEQCQHSLSGFDELAARIVECAQREGRAASRAAWLNELSEHRAAGKAWAFAEGAEDAWDWTLEDVEVKDVVPEGVELIGWGTSRLVIGLCSRHVLKVDVGSSLYQNAAELAAWDAADPWMRRRLCPVLARGAGDKPSWIVMARCEPLRGALTPLMSRRLVRETRLVVQDLVEDNIGILGNRLVVLDYGMVDQAQLTLQRARIRRPVVAAVEPPGRAPDIGVAAGL